MDYKLKETIRSYDKTVADYIKNTDKLFPKNEAKKFLALLPKNAKILDMGCGPGRDAEFFSRAGHRVTGIDLSEGMIQAAKKRVPRATFTKMNFESMRFKQEAFDGIWASAALLHVPAKKVAQVLRNCNRILAKNGILYLSIKKGKGESFEEDARYSGLRKSWTYFTRKEILEATKKAGFTTISCYELGRSASYQSHPWIIVFSRKNPRY